MSVSEMFSSGHKNHKKTKIFVLDRNITNKCFQTETLKVKKKKKKSTFMATIIERQKTVGFWAGYLVFVKWNKIQALFSLRYSKDKASGKS